MNYFKFFPVGQGLFYFGSIANGNYKFIYDCGTNSKTSYLMRSIDLLTEYDCVGTIDCIFISHFDKDHFNGIKILQDKKIIINNYIFPYLYDGEIGDLQFVLSCFEIESDSLNDKTEHKDVNFNRYDIETLLTDYNLYKERRNKEYNIYNTRLRNLNGIF